MIPEYKIRHALPVAWMPDELQRLFATAENWPGMLGGRAPVPGRCFGNRCCEPSTIRPNALARCCRWIGRASPIEWRILVNVACGIQKGRAIGQAFQVAGAGNPCTRPGGVETRSAYNAQPSAFCYSVSNRETSSITSAGFSKRRACQTTAVASFTGSGTGCIVLYLAEPADYGPDQARLAAVQRLLALAGYDAEPIDGVAGRRTDAATGLFLRERNLPAETATSPNLLDLLVDAVREAEGPGLLWCNQTPYTVMAALGVEEEGGIVARGWWRVEPGACVRPSVQRREPPRLFSFAEAIDQAGAVIERKGMSLAWGGATKLCVRNTRFEIREHNDCDARGLTVQGFAMVELGGRRGATLRFREP